MKKLINRLKTKHLLLILIAVIVIISSAGIGTVAINAIIINTQVEYEVLYENLSYKEAANVIRQLDEKNIEWQNGDSGLNTIMVPSDIKASLKKEIELK